MMKYYVAIILCYLLMIAIVFQEAWKQVLTNNRTRYIIILVKNKANILEGEQKMKKFTGFEKVAVIDRDGNTNPWCGTDKDDESNYYVFKYWSKGVYERIYVNDYKHRTLGYIDLKTEAIETDYSKNSDVMRTINFFLENYEIDVDNK